MLPYEYGLDPKSLAFLPDLKLWSKFRDVRSVVSWKLGLNVTGVIKQMNLLDIIRDTSLTTSTLVSIILTLPMEE